MGDPARGWRAPGDDEGDKQSGGSRGCRCSGGRRRHRLGGDRIRVSFESLGARAGRATHERRQGDATGDATGGLGQGDSDRPPPPLVQGRRQAGRQAAQRQRGDASAGEIVTAWRRRYFVLHSDGRLGPPRGREVRGSAGVQVALSQGPRGVIKVRRSPATERSGGDGRTANAAGATVLTATRVPRSTTP